MDQVVNDDLRLQEDLTRILTALETGAIVLDSNCEIAWMDERTRARLNGGIEQLAATLRGTDTALGVHCRLQVHEVTINGEPVTLCLIRPQEPTHDAQALDAIAAVEAAMADASWFTRAIIEKLKALRPAKQAAPRLSDLEILSDREREVLGLICEGHSDAQMGTILNLSQNTIRNHIASLYRKIGVNRRSAAIIWARERGVTSQNALPPRRRPLPQPPNARQE
jgi:DNA-binding CsgD family transcriptional regulator